jgi:hypothetical protein
MANAGGRLAGSLLSGLSYQFWGLTGCLLTASALLAIAGVITIALSAEQRLMAENRIIPYGIACSPKNGMEWLEIRPSCAI